MESVQHRRDMHHQANQAAIDFSKMLFNGAFFLNGAAATALLASKNTAFYCAAISFALGAFAALLGIGSCYLYVLLLGKTWEYSPTVFTEKSIPLYALGKERLLSRKDIEDLRLVPAAFFIVSALLFCIGIILLVCAPWAS